jgi:hypothetical protein
MTVPAPSYQGNREDLLQKIRDLPPQFRERAVDDLSKLYDEAFIKKFKSENRELFVVPPPTPIVLPKPEILKKVIPTQEEIEREAAKKEAELVEAAMKELAIKEAARKKAATAKVPQLKLEDSQTLGAKTTQVGITQIDSKRVTIQNKPKLEIETNLPD